MKHSAKKKHIKTNDVNLGTIMDEIKHDLNETLDEQVNTNEILEEDGQHIVAMHNTQHDTTLKTHQAKDKLHKDPLWRKCLCCCLPICSKNSNEDESNFDKAYQGKIDTNLNNFNDKEKKKHHKNSFMPHFEMSKKESSSFDSDKSELIEALEEVEALTNKNKELAKNIHALVEAQNDELSEIELEINETNDNQKKANDNITDAINDSKKKRF